MNPHISSHLNIKGKMGEPTYLNSIYIHRLILDIFKEKEIIIGG